MLALPADPFIDGATVRPACLIEMHEVDHDLLRAKILD
jgi:hypothetical protein